MVRGALLDIDGTLVLSNDAHTHAWVQAFTHHGYHVRFSQVRPLIGMGGDKLMPQLVPQLDSESGTGKEISEYRSKLFLEKYAPELEPAPGSRQLVMRLRASGLKLVVATSAKEHELGALLKAAGVDDLLHEMTTSSDVEQSKPDPDIVHAALTKISLPPSETIMLGDTPYDIVAANQAGVGIVSVRCGGWQDDDLGGSLAIYDNPADLLAHYEASPFASII